MLNRDGDASGQGAPSAPSGPLEQIVSDYRFDPELVRARYQPHWVWALTFVVAPIVLLGIAFLGVPEGSSISATVATNAARVAWLMPAFGLVIGFYRRRTVLVEITGLGLLISTCGFLWLLWVT